MTTTREILIRARALVETPEKWFHGPDSRGDGCHCVATALAEVGDFYVRPYMRKRCYAALGFDNMHEIWAWNDAPSRTHSDILAAFDKAIESCQ